MQPSTSAHRKPAAMELDAQARLRSRLKWYKGRGGAKASWKTKSGKSLISYAPLAQCFFLVKSNSFHNNASAEIVTLPPRCFQLHPKLFENRNSLFPLARASLTPPLDIFGTMPHLNDIDLVLGKNPLKANGNSSD